MGLAGARTRERACGRAGTWLGGWRHSNGHEVGGLGVDTRDRALAREIAVDPKTA